MGDTYTINASTTFNQVQASITNATGPVTFVLEANFVVSNIDSLTILDGKDITFESASGQEFSITHNGTTSDKPGFIEVSGSALTLRNIVVDGLASAVHRRCVFIKAGALTLENGAHIINGGDNVGYQGATGGGVLAINATTGSAPIAIVMKPGSSISDCRVDSGAASFPVYGGAIALEGVNVSLDMQGTISHNSAKTNSGSGAYGGGIAVRNGASAVISGTVSDNQASSNSATAAVRGGGIYVDASSSCTLQTGAAIIVNKAGSPVCPGYGGGVANESDSFTMSGGGIFNNIALPVVMGKGDDLYTGTASFTMSGGSISIPSPMLSACSVYLAEVAASGKTFAMSGDATIFGSAVSESDAHTITLSGSPTIAELYFKKMGFTPVTILSAGLTGGSVKLMGLARSVTTLNSGIVAVQKQGGAALTDVEAGVFSTGGSALTTAPGGVQRFIRSGVNLIVGPVELVPKAGGSVAGGIALENAMDPGIAGFTALDPLQYSIVTVGNIGLTKNNEYTLTAQGIELSPDYLATLAPGRYAVRAVHTADGGYGSNVTYGIPAAYGEFVIGGSTGGSQPGETGPAWSFTGGGIGIPGGATAPQTTAGAASSVSAPAGSTFQWQAQQVGGAWQNIPGATSSTLNTSAGLTPGRNYSVRCVIVSPGGAQTISQAVGFTAGTTAFGGKGACIGGNVNVRSIDNLWNVPIGKMQRGGELTLLGYSNNFFKIAWAGAPGGYAYISADYVDAMFDTPIDVKITGTVYVQTQKNTASQYRALTLKAGDTVTVIGRQGKWWVVMIDGNIYYMLSGRNIQV